MPTVVPIASATKLRARDAARALSCLLLRLGRRRELMCICFAWICLELIVLGGEWGGGRERGGFPVMPEVAVALAWPGVCVCVITDSRVC